MGRASRLKKERHGPRPERVEKESAEFRQDFCVTCGRKIVIRQADPRLCKKHDVLV
jgi:hypothetical protein